MFLVKKVTDLKAVIQSLKGKKSTTIGFVPTMGALHEGHLSLIKKCAAENTISVCSIFVNPTQFNNPEDLKRYPRPIDEDIQLLSQQNCCDILFAPSESEMYPDEISVKKAFQLGELENILEGKFRPGHFQGVAHIVSKLLKIVAPDYLYMGQKDYQQCLVVNKIIEQEKLSVKLVICPTQRQADGLAMSSRNRLLTEPQRALAGLLYQCLISIQTQKAQKDFSTVQKECNDLLTAKGFEPDYIALANAKNLQALSNYQTNTAMVALIAASIGKVRLIDNLLI